ncbi:MAG: D-glycero-beta-D-manno-heptose-7-phosphate kinase [Deltaproteobacteria bacterium]|nr:D-glycero-beta-D-manno-heptose-7-phosphate kinase [Deltaproteobacteria bacterium]
MNGLEEARLAALVDAFDGVSLLVVGDVMLDEYLWGDAERISPEAPVPVVHVARESEALGGAGNVVRNVVALGGRCHLCAVIGDDGVGRRVADLLKALGVDPGGLVALEGRPTTRKTRLVARNQQLLRFDRENEDEVSAEDARRLLRQIESTLPFVDGVIFEDYAKGVLSESVIRGAMDLLNAAEVPIAVDPKHSLAPYRGATLVKPNLRETEVLSGVRIRSPEDLARAVAALREELGEADFVVTRGSSGMTVFEGDAPGVDVRTAAREVFDVQGAGDTTIATLVLALRAGGSLLEAAVIANAAAGVVLGKVGTATATPGEVKALLPAAIEAAEAQR